MNVQTTSDQVSNDNLFQRLFELFQTSDPINWKLAREITRGLVGEAQPIDPVIAEEYQELALAAQLRIAPVIPLEVGDAPIPDPVDRSAWGEANLRGFTYVIEPLIDRLAETDTQTELGEMLASLRPALLGMQAGTFVGFLSLRTLGQFDTGLPPGDRATSLLVVPNVEDFANEQGLDTRQVRLWATMQETLHHAVRKVSWLEAHLRDLFRDYYAAMKFDASGFADTLEGGDVSDLQSMLSGGPATLASLLGAEEQPEKAAPIKALSALVAGYGDFVVDQAASEMLPDIAAISDAINQRRLEGGEAERFLEQLVGIDLERGRARDATEFCRQVADRWGEDALGRLWTTAEHLPTLVELADPVGWAARVLLD